MNPTSRTLQSEAPCLFSLLSDLGRTVEFTADIPFQAAQARDKKLNATIGQITDGHGSPMPLEPMREALSGLQGEDLSRALLYSPIAGIDELRRRWSERQHQAADAGQFSSLPVVTVGLTHGLSLIADIFAGPGRPVALATPFWGNYAQTFATRTGGAIRTAPAYVDGRFNCEAVAQALDGVPAGQPALAVLNLPSNPGGYMPTRSQRERIRRSLVGVAEERPLLVVCDDAYQGLVYEQEVPPQSIYWDLIGAHEQMIPVKVDGVTKELSFFGGRVGFLTFPFPPDGPVAQALESKLKGLIRATLGSPVATSQIVALAALRSGSLAAEEERVRDTLGARYRSLKESLSGLDLDRIRTLPFNAGCFALLELCDPRVDSESIRRRLLAEYDTGLIAIAPRYLRVAFCSLAAAAAPELARRIAASVESA